MTDAEDDIPRAVRERFHDVNGELVKAQGGVTEVRFVLEEVVRPTLARLTQDMRDDRKRADDNYNRVGSEIGNVRDDLAKFKTEMSRELATARESLAHQIGSAQQEQSRQQRNMMWGVILAGIVGIVNIALNAASSGVGG